MPENEVFKNDPKKNPMDDITSDQLLDILNKEIGFKYEIPDIMTFVRDPYYLGSVYNRNNKMRIYPVWLDRLQKVFPNPTVQNSFISVSGSIGCGKSTFSTICMAYAIYKMACIPDLGGTFLDLVLNKGVHAKFFNIFKSKVFEMIKPLNEWIRGDGKEVEPLPCFKDLMSDPEMNLNKITVTPAKDTKDILSLEVNIMTLSEINFFKTQKAYEIITSCLSRLDSRFMKGADLLNLFILDSSDVSKNSPTETFTKNSAYADKFLCFRTAIFDSKPWQFFHIPNPITKKYTFKVYAGDSTKKPFIMSDDDEKLSKEELSKKYTIDADRILDIPNELLPNFKADINLALQEKVGVALSNSDYLFPEEHLLRPHFNINKSYDDVTMVDFYDDEKIIDKPGILDAVNAIPDDRYLYIGVDIGYKNDKAGICIGYCDSYKEKMVGGLKVKEPQIKIPVLFSLSRIQGQETSIAKIRDFIIYLHSKKNVKCLITDSFQNVSLFQELKAYMEKDKTKPFKFMMKTLSTERVEHPLIFKRLLYSNLIDIAKNEYAIKELLCLIYTEDGKIDHSMNVANEDGTTSLQNASGVNSKDIFDALVRVVSTINDDGASAALTPEKKKEVIKNLYGELNKEMVNSMIRSRFLSGTLKEKEVPGEY